MNGMRPRTRFVPTLTEVVQVSALDKDVPGPNIESAHEHSASELGSRTGEIQAPVATSVSAFATRSVLEAAVDDMMPAARAQLRQSLQLSAQSLIEDQVRSMEETLRQRLRVALREATGMGRKSENG